jgi:hypothetical protein
MDHGSTARALLVLACTLSPAGQAAPAVRARLTQAPLVMRLSPDEFRIAFGIAAPGCAAGCSGVIRYRVDWRTEDGATLSEVKRVGYSVVPHSSRTITVDRQFFDTAEGAHRVEVVKVRVASISCRTGAGAAPAQLAALEQRAP